MFRRGAVVALSFLAVLALAPAASQAGTATRSKPAAFGEDRRVFTDNIGSGSECTHYNCMSVVINQVAAFHPDGISVVEACRSDATKFKKAYPHWDVRFTYDSHHNSKCGGHDKGNFVAAPKITASFTVELAGFAGAPDDTFLLCAQTGNLWVCNTHLPYRKPGFPHLEAIHRKEVQQMETALDHKTWTALCGDFNLYRHDKALTPLRETNWKDTYPGHTGAAEHVAFDYIWWHKPNDAKVKADRAHIVRQPRAHFDHDMLQGRVDW